MRVFLVIPPLTQLNTPYPSTAYLTGYLRKIGFDVSQYDFSIELVTRLFSRDSFTKITGLLLEKKSQHESVQFFLKNKEAYINAVDSVVKFLQGRDPSLAVRIANRNLSSPFIPNGPRVRKSESELSKNNYLDFAFGAVGIQDRAKYYASLFIEDLTDVIREGVDPRFEISRYAEKLASSRVSFDDLEAALEAKNPTFVDQLLETITIEQIDKNKPDAVGLSVPFPGNVYGALRIARTIKKKFSGIKIIFGGGYANTELRSLSCPKIFNYVDFIPLDDGEKPFELILKYLKNDAVELKKVPSTFLRTFICENGEVKYVNTAKDHDISMKDSGTPTYDGLPLEKYMSVLEMLNPMHRLWSDARWNKVTLAHGCYWKKCSFCDVSLDYIGRYDPLSADQVIDRMQSLSKETGVTGFHFVDEACPPITLKNLSQRIVERNLNFSWWGNLRFDKTFTRETAKLMADAGCIAVTGGLEVASDRLLKLMDKGVTIEQVAKVTKAFNESGIMVHAYLMYGFPTQTVQETIDSLEVVRQLFVNGCLDSAYWHRFSATVHSPIGKNPQDFGIKILNKEKNCGKIFAINDLEFSDPTGTDHNMLGRGLKRALYNYMHGIGLESDVREWFEVPVPKSLVKTNLVRDSL